VLFCLSGPFLTPVGKTVTGRVHSVDFYFETLFFLLRKITVESYRVNNDICIDGIMTSTFNHAGLSGSS